MAKTTIITPPNDPCGCGSGQPFGRCCLRNNTIVKKPKIFLPPPPHTGVSSKYCLLRTLNDCGDGKSGDHIVSRAVLKELSTEFQLSSRRFSGLSRLDSDVLKTNSFCRRHNSSFSPIDSEMGRFVRAIKSILISLDTGHGYQESRFFIFSGDDIENWMIKTALNTFRAGYTSVRSPEFQMHPDTWKLLSHEIWPPAWGFYLTGQVSNYPIFGTENQFTWNFVTSGTRVCGMRISFFGFPIGLIFEYGDNYLLSNNHPLATFGIWRPRYIVIYKGTQVHTLALTWDRPCFEGTVYISHGFSHSPPTGAIGVNS